MDDLEWINGGWFDPFEKWYIEDLALQESTAKSPEKERLEWLRHWIVQFSRVAKNEASKDTLLKIIDTGNKSIFKEVRQQVSDVIDVYFIG